jgi:hypothetical protein
MGITKGDKIMDIVLFNKITTSEALAEITSESERNIGLYADLHDPEQRKYIKQEGEKISSVRKVLNEFRIKLVKDYTLSVNKEFNYADSVLIKAAEPITLLIDGYKSERKVILDKEKAKKLAIENAIQKEVDHEFAILLDKSYLADKLAAEQAQAERDEAIRIDATNREKSKAALAEALEAAAVEARIKDKNNVRAINRDIYSGFIFAGLAREEATKATQAMIDGLIPNITINY